MKVRASTAAFYMRQAVVLWTGVEEKKAVIRLLYRHLRGMSKPAVPLWVTLKKSGLKFPVQEFIQVWWLRETFIDNAYEKAGCPLEPGWNVVDVGAATGDFSMFASEQRGARRVIAVEANPDAFELLKLTIATNGSDRVTPHHVAIDDLDGTVFMEPDSFTISRTDKPGTVAVRASRLSSLLDIEGLSSCDLLKLDCEGAEFPILFGLGAADFERLPRIIMETHEGPGRKVSDLRSLLQDYGYKVTTTPHPVHPQLGYLYAERVVDGSA